MAKKLHKLMKKLNPSDEISFDDRVEFDKKLEKKYKKLRSLQKKAVSHAERIFHNRAKCEDEMQLADYVQILDTGVDTAHLLVHCLNCRDMQNAQQGSTNCREYTGLVVFDVNMDIFGMHFDAADEFHNFVAFSYIDTNGECVISSGSKLLSGSMVPVGLIEVDIPEDYKAALLDVYSKLNAQKSEMTGRSNCKNGKKQKPAAPRKNSAKSKPTKSGAVSTGGKHRNKARAAVSAKSGKSDTATAR